MEGWDWPRSWHCCSYIRTCEKKRKKEVASRMFSSQQKLTLAGVQRSNASQSNPDFQYSWQTKGSSNQLPWFFFSSKPMVCFQALCMGSSSDWGDDSHPLSTLVIRHKWNKSIYIVNCLTTCLHTQVTGRASYRVHAVGNSYTVHDKEVGFVCF